jgi:hypothetical protein
VKQSAVGRLAAGRLTFRRVNRPEPPHFPQEMTMDKHTSDAPADRGDDSEVATGRRSQVADMSERADQVQKIKAAADERDERADARDIASTKRDMAANLDTWIRHAEDDEAHEARELASEDRMHSRRDRVASAADRDHLTANDSGSLPDGQHS